MRIIKQGNLNKIKKINLNVKNVVVFCGDHRNTCEECLFCLGTEFEIWSDEKEN